MKNQQGFTFIEIIIAIVIITTGVVGVYTLLPHIISSVSLGYNRFIALQLAREGVEIVRNIRDSNWLEQLENSANPWDEQLSGSPCSTGCQADCAIFGQENLFGSYNDDSTSFLRIDSDGFYKYTPPGGRSQFKRKITITNPAVDTLRVQVEVFWSASGFLAVGGNSVTVVEDIYNWR